MPARRKPISQLIASGTYRADRHGAIAGRNGSSDPLGDPPDHLDDSARNIWREVAAVAPWLRLADVHAVEMYSSLMAKFRADPTGLGGRPLALLISLAGKLGLTWNDRQRQRPDPPDEARGELGPNDPARFFAGQDELLGGNIARLHRGKRR